MDNTVGKNIYMLRKKHGLTQEELARRINVSFQAISKWETGQFNPRYFHLAASCKYFSL